IGKRTFPFFQSKKGNEKITAPSSSFKNPLWVDRPGKVVDGSHIPGTDGTEVFLPQKVGSPQLENGFYTGNPIVDLGIQHGKGGNLPIGKGSLPKIAVAPPVVHIETKDLEQGGVP